jgi:hypothetical protein
MAEDNNWKLVERTCVVVGTMAAVGAFGFEALNYFKAPITTNQAVAHTAPPAPSFPLWIVIVLVIFAILLLGTGMMMMVERRRRERRTALALPVAPRPSVAEFSRDQYAVDARRSRPVSLFEAWDKVDPISLYDASSLWVEEDPTALLGHILTGPAGGMLKRLQQAHVAKLITASRPYGLDIIGGNRYPPEPNEVVSRQELVALAERWKERPKFLFPEERDR